MSAKTKKRLDLINKKDDELANINKELFELADDEEMIDYKDRFGKSFETTKGMKDENDRRIRFEGLSQKDIDVLNKCTEKREALIKKYEEKLKAKDLDYKKLYTEFEKESADITDETRKNLSR